MGGGNEEARNLLAQEPGRVDCQAVAANTQIVAQRKPARHSGGTPYTVRANDDCAFVIVVFGCVQWSINQLRRAGAAGCTPTDNSAPHMAAYVHSFCGIGFHIETINAAHEGGFPGHHARYFLRSEVSLGQNWGAV